MGQVPYLEILFLVSLVLGYRFSKAVAMLLALFFVVRGFYEGPKITTEHRTLVTRFAADLWNGGAVSDVQALPISFQVNKVVRPSSPTVTERLQRPKHNKSYNRLVLMTESKTMVVSAE